MENNMHIVIKSNTSIFIGETFQTASKPIVYYDVLHSFFFS